METVFVLVDPAVPENVGAVARALKTMGFSRLRLVGSDFRNEEKAAWIAHGSRDVLEGAGFYGRLDEAVADCDFVIGTTARRRGRRHEYHTPEETLDLLERKGSSVRRAALVFGREESGLSNDELRLCDCLSSIPMASAYPSLNLGQSVMVYAYVLASRPDLAMPDSGKPDRDGGGEAAFRALKLRAERLLPALGFPKGDLVGGRLLERMSALGLDDLKLLHSLCAELEKLVESKGT